VMAWAQPSRRGTGPSMSLDGAVATVRRQVGFSRADPSPESVHPEEVTAMLLSNLGPHPSSGR